MSSDLLWWCHQCRRPLRNDRELEPNPADTVTGHPHGGGAVAVTHDQCGGGSVAWSLRSGTA